MAYLPITNSMLPLQPDPPGKELFRSLHFYCSRFLLEEIDEKAPPSTALLLALQLLLLKGGQRMGNHTNDVADIHWLA